MKKYGNERIKKILRIMELPTNTKFKGYVLHLPEEDEFMGIVDHGSYNSPIITYGWASTPENAIVFKQHKKAIRELKEYGKNNIQLHLLFELETQFLSIAETALNELMEIGKDL